MDFLTSYIVPLYVLTVFAVIYTTTVKSDRTEKYLYLVLSALWVLCALTRPWGVSPDDIPYEGHYAFTCKFSECGFDVILTFSYLYYLGIGALSDWVDGYTVFLVMSAIFLTGKFLIIGRATKWATPALLLYVSIFFQLHDVVQFRAAVAAFWYLLALYLLMNRRWILATASYVTSVFVHFQAAVAPATYLAERVFKHRYWLALGVALGSQVLVQVGLTPTAYVLDLLGTAGLIEERLANTIDQDLEATGVRLTSLAIMILAAFAIPELQKQSNRVQVLGFYSVIAGFLLYWVGGSVGGISNRLLQFMWVPLVFVAPLCRRNIWFFGALLGVCCSFFYLQGWVIRLMGN